MTTPVDLPAALRDKLAALAWRVRLLRVLRGLGWLVLALALSFLALFLADRWLDLPDDALAVVLAGLAAGAAAVLLAGVVVPLCRRLSPGSLAALVEKHYPDLGERLTSSVELAGCPGAAHGSRALIALLLEETESRARPLEFGRAFPARPTARLLGAAGAALLLALLPALTCGEEYADFGGRFLSAWSAPAPFALRVHPGDRALAAGQPLTVSVHVERRNDRVAWPESCYLVTTDGAGSVERVPMRGDGPGAFTYTLGEVRDNLGYHVESGRVVSESFHVIAVQPVALAPGSPACVLTPPPYVNPAVHPQQTLKNFSELSALQYSRVRLTFRFTRPAMAARLEVTAAEADGRAGKGWVLPVTLSADRAAAALEMPALAVGSYGLRLHAEAEHGITFRHDLPPLTVWADEPPAFTERPRLAGLAESDAVGGGAGPNVKRATPRDELRLKVGVEDRVGVGLADVEYRVNGGQPRVEPILDAKGALTASAEHVFRLAGKVKDGDVVHFRVRAADNRRLARGACRDAHGRAVPEGDLAPQVIYRPERVRGADRWFVLRIDSRAEPLPRQGILAERDDINRRLEAVRERLAAERGQLGRVRASSKEQSGLTAGQARNLDGVRRENKGVIGDLLELAREAARAPALQAVAGQAQGVAEGEMTRAGEELGRAREKQKDAPAREQHLQKADRELAAALARLGELRRLNDRLAQDRLDQLQMEQLARREADLAKRAAELAGKRPPDPTTPKALDGLRAEQEKVTAALRRLGEESRLFREALASDRARRAKALAATARKLAEAQRDLGRDEDAALRKQTDELLARFARQQQELADSAARLSPRATGPAPPARAAALALEQGRADEALRLQGQAAADLERTAEDVERALAAGRDPREAARRLARVQEKLGNRLEEEASRVALKPARELLKDLDDLRRDQEGVKRAAENIPVHPGNGPALEARQEAAARAADATRALARRDPFQAHEDMQQAREALDRLAGQLPPGADPDDLMKHLAAQQARADRVGELARQLRGLADRARQLHERRAEQTPDNVRSLKRETEELARRLEREAPAAAARDAALREMAAAGKALKGPAGLPAAKEALARAAAAAEGLAKELARERAAGQAERERSADLRRLSQDQKALRDALRQALADPAKAAGPSSGKTAQEMAGRQDAVAREVDGLKAALRRMAKGADLAANARQAAEKAAASGEQAEDAMKQGREASRQGNPGRARQAREGAVQMLERAGRQAGEAAAAMAGKPGEGSPSAAASREAGRAARQGQRQAEEAQARLGQGRPGAAQGALRQAAQLLGEAAQQAGRALARQGQKAGPPTNAGSGWAPAGGGGKGGRPGLVPLDKPGQPATARPWGQLPGELRTRLLQDLRARYGDDYAAIIQGYFRAIADTGK
jgi:hypothetical protein